MWRATTLILILMSALAARFSAADDEPVRVEVTERGQGKVYYCVIDLQLTNLHDFTVWFLISKGDQLLRYNGQFSSDAPYLSAKHPFEAMEYDQGEGKGIIVSHYGRDGFKAVHLPAKGRFHYRGYMIHVSNEPPRFVDVWEAKTLKVNGKSPLEKWLPYSVLSSAKVELTEPVDWENHQKLLEFGAGEAAPAEKVTSVVAEPLLRYLIPLPE